MDNQITLIGLGILATLLGTVLFSRAYNMRRGMKFAEWVAGEGQYMPLEESIIDEAIQVARNAGTEKQFLALLRRVRSVRGHSNVKVGHLYWIWDQIEKGVRDVDSPDVPSFTKGQ